MLWDNTLIDLFWKGGFAMWPLLLLSILGLAVLLDRTFVVLWLHTDFEAFLRRWEPLLRTGRVEEVQRRLARSRTPVGTVTLAYLTHRQLPPHLREQIIAREGSRQLARLERRMSWLGMIASVATMLGLLGTVTGLVTAFHQIEIRTGQVQPSDLAAGIWEALITTVFGLVIAIPCLAGYHLLDSQVGKVGLQLQWLTVYLDEWLTAGSSGPPSPGPRVFPARERPYPAAPLELEPEA